MKYLRKLLLFLLCAVMLLNLPVVSYSENTSNAVLAQLYEQIAAQGGNEQITADDAKALAQYYAILAKQETKGDSNTASVVNTTNVTAKIMALQATYPDGTPWGMETPYVTRSKYPHFDSSGKACLGFAYLVQDAAFGTQKYTCHETGLRKYISNKVGNGNSYKIVTGNSVFLITREEYTSDDPEWDLVMQTSNDNSWIAVYPDYTRIYDGMDTKINAQFEKIWSKLSVGDMIVDDDHAAVVLTKNDTGITVVEGNYKSSVKWGRYISKETLRVALYEVYSCQW